MTVFGKDQCARCLTTKHKILHLVRKWGLQNRVELSFLSMNTAQGLAEAMFNEVRSVPTVILSSVGKELARWDGIVPLSADLRRQLHEALRTCGAAFDKGIHSQLPH
jgi:thioredoxin-like negative regulator of GroEL